jgi:hypothetical protein
MKNQRFACEGFQVTWAKKGNDDQQAIFEDAY